MPSAQDPTRLMQGVIPYLSIAGARDAIAFYQRAFGAEVLGDVTTMPGDGRVANAALVINGGVLMLADHFPDQGYSAAKGGQGVTMQLVIDDGEAWWSRAIGAGCEILKPFEAQFCGDRYGQLRDPFGIDWALNEPSVESKRKVQEGMSPGGATPKGPVEDISITRILDAPRAAVWRCWTEGDLLKQWFCPKPWTVSVADLDVRPGGKSRIVMNGPNGERNDLPGQYLEVIPHERLAFTDAFVGGWKPGAGKPFMTAFVELSDAPGGKTTMLWGARHWTAEDRANHLNMGFEQGWNATADQLNTLVKTLA